MAEVKVTYETLFDLLRREKSRNELQVLDASFYPDVVGYMKDKLDLLHGSSSRSEQEKIKIQLANIRKILRELYELREKKIIGLAMNKVRTDSNLIDTSSLLSEERKLFDDACLLLARYKHGIVDRVVSEELPSIIGDVTAEEFKGFTYGDSSDKGIVKETLSVKEKEPEVASVSSHDGGIRLKILVDLPKFMGLDNKVYGPFKKEDVALMPENMAMLLVKKSRASKLD